MNFTFCNFCIILDPFWNLNLAQNFGATQVKICSNYLLEPFHAFRMFCLQNFIKNNSFYLVSVTQVWNWEPDYQYFDYFWSTLNCHINTQFLGLGSKYSKFYNWEWKNVEFPLKKVDSLELNWSTFRTPQIRFKFCGTMPWNPTTGYDQKW